MQVVERASLSTPLGSLSIFARGRVIVAVEFHGRNRAIPGLRRWIPRMVVEDSKDPARLSEPLARYFEGHLDALADVTVAPFGTVFQQEVWAMLRQIPFGDTISYSEVARRIQRPKAVRAVGLANGQNPIPIIIPCHRVIGANGSLTGYGSGLDRKDWLLRHEVRCSTLS